MQGLTISLALFIILILAPGYAYLWAAGRTEDALRDFALTLSRGVIIFIIGLTLIFFISNNKAKVLLDWLQGNYNQLDWYYLGCFTAGFYILAVLLGCLQFASDLGHAKRVKLSPAWKKFLVKGQPFQITPEDNAFWDIFLCYRATGKRPVVKVYFDNEGLIHGEAIKVNMGRNPGILIADYNNLHDLAWVPFNKIKFIVFCGQKQILNYKLDSKTKELLNLIHPGYGDETEKKLRRIRPGHNRHQRWAKSIEQSERMS